MAAGTGAGTAKLDAQRQEVLEVVVGHIVRGPRQIGAGRGATGAGLWLPLVILHTDL